MLATRMWHEMDLRDRDLLERWSLDAGAQSLSRSGWVVMTHAGGAWVTIASALLPPLLAPWPRAISASAAAALTLSHLLVQGMKRLVNRQRPSRQACIRCPDQFSFPSGHATAALAVALSYALAFPAFAPLLVPFAMLVGWSRVILGVHYPGDVVVGQLIAVGTVLLLT